MIFEQITPKKRLNIRTGDVFAYKLTTESFYRVGYIIEKDGIVGAMHQCTILQFFTTTITTLDEEPILNPDDFLCHPLIEGGLCWKEGYFQNIKRKVELDGRKTFYFQEKYKKSNAAFYDNHGNKFDEIPQTIHY